MANRNFQSRNPAAVRTGLPLETRQKPENVPSRNLDHLATAEKERYGPKLQLLGTCDPYTAPSAVFQPLKTARSLPELVFNYIYVYLDLDG